MSSIGFDFLSPVSPPQSGTGANHVVRAYSPVLSAIGSDGIQDLEITLSPFSELFDAATHKIATMYEYYKIEEIMITIAFVNNWLKARGALAMAFVSDPSISFATFEDFMRQETAVLVRDVKSHVWKVPIPQKWLYVKTGFEQRLFLLGKIRFWCKPKRSNEPALMNESPPFNFTVDSIISFKRETLIQAYAPILTISKWTGIFTPINAVVIFPGGNVRSGVIRIKTLQGTPKAGSNGFLSYTFPIDFVFTLRDGQEPNANKVIFSERHTAGEWMTPEDSGYLYIDIPTTIASRVDFSQFFITEVTATLPGDYPFENKCYISENVPLASNITASFDGVENEPLDSY